MRHQVVGSSNSRHNCSSSSQLWELEEVNYQFQINFLVSVHCGHQCGSELLKCTFPLTMRLSSQSLIL